MCVESIDMVALLLDVAFTLPCPGCLGTVSRGVFRYFTAHACNELGLGTDLPCLSGRLPGHLAAGPERQGGAEPSAAWPCIRRCHAMRSGLC